MTRPRHDTPALTAAILAAITAEPGEWSVSTLAEDLDVHPARVARLLTRHPHRRERVGNSLRLWPADSVDPGVRLRAYLAEPRTRAEVARYLGLRENAAWRRLRDVGAVARYEPAGRRYVWRLP